MACLHSRFWVINHHISSGSNPDLGPEVPNRLLNLVLLVDFFSAEFVLFIVNSSQWEEFFTFIYIYIYIYIYKVK